MLGDVTFGQYYNARSFLHKTDPRTKILLLIAYIVAVFLAQNFLSLAAVLVFLIVEVIRGKRVPPEKEGYVHLAGMALFLCLMVFVMYNDIRRIFF